MGRNKTNYTHGDSGTKPSSLNFESNERPNSEHFDWWWKTVSNAIDAHADEFNRFDGDNDGKVDAADYADNADAVDGQDWSDIQVWVGNNYLPDGQYTPEADTHDPPTDSEIVNAVDPHGNDIHDPNFATKTEVDNKPDDPHGNEAHNPNFATETDLSGKAGNPHGNEAHDPNFLDVTYDPETDIHNRPVAGEHLTEDGSNNFNVDKSSLNLNFASDPHGNEDHDPNFLKETGTHGNEVHEPDFLSDVKMEMIDADRDLSKYTNSDEVIDVFGVQDAWDDYAGDNAGTIDYVTFALAVRFWRNGNSVPSDGIYNAIPALTIDSGEVVSTGMVSPGGINIYMEDSQLIFKNGSGDKVGRLDINGNLEIAGTVTENVNF